MVFLSGGAEEGCEILGEVQTVRLIHPGGAEKGCQPSWGGAWKRGQFCQGGREAWRLVLEEVKRRHIKPVDRIHREGGFGQGGGNMRAPRFAANH